MKLKTVIENWPNIDMWIQQKKRSMCWKIVQTYAGSRRRRYRRSRGEMQFVLVVALHPAHLAGAGRGTLSAISITSRAVAHSRRHVDGRSQAKFVLPYILGLHSSNSRRLIAFLHSSSSLQSNPRLFVLRPYASQRRRCFISRYYVAYSWCRVLPIPSHPPCPINS